MRVALLALLLAGCAEFPTHEPIAPPRPIIHTITNRVEVPKPVPCFTEAEQPRPPAPTAIDLATATTDQKAAALAADAEALANYARLVDALLLKCLAIVQKGVTP